MGTPRWVWPAALYGGALLVGWLVGGVFGAAVFALLALAGAWLALAARGAWRRTRR